MIIDACMFYNELDMLELRFRTLEDTVAYFVVCEADLTHSGRPKPMTLADNMERFSRWRDQLIYVTVNLPTDVDSWTRERMHRENLRYGIALVATDNDLVVVGDCDEIPRPEALRKVNPAMGAKLELDFFYYNARTRVKQGWAIGCLPWGDEQSPNKIRTLEGHTVETIDKGGWHFSYFMDSDAIVDKLNAFMHHGDIAANVPRDADYIRKRIEAGQDIYSGRGIQLESVPLADDLPPALLSDARYEAWR